MSNLILTAVNILAGLILFIHCVCRLSVRRWTVKQPELWAHAALAGGAIGIICSPLIDYTQPVPAVSTHSRPKAAGSGHASLG